MSWKCRIEGILFPKDLLSFCKLKQKDFGLSVYTVFRLNHSSLDPFLLGFFSQFKLECSHPNFLAKASLQIEAKKVGKDHVMMMF